MTKFIQTIKHTKIHKNKGFKKRSKSNFQTRNKTRLCDSKTKPQDVTTNVKMDIYYTNVCCCNPSLGQGLAKVLPKSEAWESHFMLLGV
jgi:hypothetical protein